VTDRSHPGRPLRPRRVDGVIGNSCGEIAADTWVCSPGDVGLGLRLLGVRLDGTTPHLQDAPHPGP
jgi:hypothetical protein